MKVTKEYSKEISKYYKIVVKDFLIKQKKTKKFKIEVKPLLVSCVIYTNAEAIMIWNNLEPIP